MEYISNLKYEWDAVYKHEGLLNSLHSSSQLTDRKKTINELKEELYLFFIF